jgi:hypothetical protein
VPTCAHHKHACVTRRALTSTHLDDGT